MYVLTGTYINTYLMFLTEQLSAIWCDTCISLPFSQVRLDLSEVKHSGRENLLYLCLNKKLPYGVPNVVFI